MHNLHFVVVNAETGEDACGVAQDLIEDYGNEKFSYSVSTNTIWTSFDIGEVEADNYEDARQLAIEKLKADFRKANEALAAIGFDVQFAEDQVEVTEE